LAIRIALADDHEVVRRAVATFLARQPDLDVVGEAGEAGPPLYNLLGDARPDVLLLDANMPGHDINVIETVRTLRSDMPDLRVLVLTAHDRREYVVGLIRSGAAGYVLKGDSPEMLLHAIRIVASGGEWISPSVANLLVEHARNDEPSPAELLSDREHEVLRAMARGLTNAKIAEELFITEQTVKNHVSSIFSKLGVNTRVEAVLYALYHGLALPGLPGNDN
jgi:DNA-binding NarL/FixJ family response regulator